MNVSIITVTWNSRKNIGEQISSVQAAAAGVQYEHIIIDNASTDGTPEFLKQMSEITFIENKQNLGFGAANNQGVKIAQGDYILFLNPDMRLVPNSLSAVLGWLEARPEVGIASITLTDEKGEYKQAAGPRRFPTLFDQLAIMLKIPHLFPKILNHYLMADFDPKKEQKVDSVRGSFMLVRRELIKKLGWGFDPRYWFWFEDVDTCREAYRNGYEVWYTPVISAVDYVGQSVKQRGSLWKQKQFTASMLIYFDKWGPRSTWYILKFFRPVAIGLVWLQEKIHKRAS